MADLNVREAEKRAKALLGGGCGVSRDFLALVALAREAGKYLNYAHEQQYGPDHVPECPVCKVLADLRAAGLLEGA